jgi:hypothetical protein
MYCTLSDYFHLLVSLVTLLVGVRRLERTLVRVLFYFTPLRVFNCESQILQRKTMEDLKQPSVT